MATVKPLRATPHAATAKPVAGQPPRFQRKVPTPPAAPAAAPAKAPVRQGPGTTLDGGWDKRLSRGMVIPDWSIDLHGHTLASAHALLDHGLGQAIARGDRVVLLVTGKPPRPESERPHARGAIRAAIADWLGSSRHADAIAAVRGAHPRHGGAGALYIVLRRGR
jgi:DNA-nicking Smr family endonuclease